MSEETEKKESEQTEIAVLTHRIGDIETKLDTLSRQVDVVRTESFPSLESVVGSLKTFVTVTNVINVGSIIIGIIVSKIVR